MSLPDTYAQWLAAPHPARPDTAVAGRPVRQAMNRGRRKGDATAEAWARLEAVWRATPERVWAWSDLHLFHANILRYTGRPHPGVEAMNAALLAAAQAQVAPEDWLLFGGDLSLGSGAQTAAWLAQCPGHKALILGNHDVDRGKLTHPDWHAVWDQFEAIHTAVAWDATPDAPAVWLTHYPLGSDQIPTGTINVHGHIHQHHLPGSYLNLSVEQQAFQPQRLSERLKALAWGLAHPPPDVVRGAAAPGPP